MVTAGDLSLQFSNSSLSNSAGKSDQDGKRIKRVMLVNKRRIVIAKKGKLGYLWPCCRCCLLLVKCNWFGGGYTGQRHCGNTG